MIVYNPTTDRFELYSTAALAYGTDPEAFMLELAAFINAIAHAQ